MPFENVLPHSFTATSIRSHAPSGPGVYGISNAREWLLIGGSENIQGTLMDHLQKQETDFGGRRATGFVYELSRSTGALVARRDRLIEQYAPVCNQLR